jgi:hypothetical protein
MLAHAFKAWAALLVGAGVALGQAVCNGTPAYTPCDFSFDLQAGEDLAQADLRAEFRSPHHKTYLMRAFRDGDRRLVIRFAPTEAGEWTYKLSSGLSRWEGQELRFTAADSDSPGFIHVANVHHFATDNKKAHLWISAALESFLTISRVDFDAQIAQRSAEKFTHVRVTIEKNADLNEAAARLRAINARGLIADVAFAAFPEDHTARTAYITDVVLRLTPFNVTWMGLADFERTPHGRPLLKEAGTLIKRLDPYQHPMTTLAAGSSGGVLNDGWADMYANGTADSNVGSVEHQLYQSPAINTGIKSANDLWNATMNGQYPASGSGAFMKVWSDFMAGNRYWELEPYFDVDGARAIALEGVEYIVYVEKPGPIEVGVEQHGYDVSWINPATGERIRAKEFKGERFAGEPPNKNQPWILHISRESHKEGMLRSYKFDSRPIPIQEVEQNPQKTPFDITDPKEGDLQIGKPVHYTLHIKRNSRATRSLLVEWTAEVVVDGEGYRVVGTGMEGTLRVPPEIVNKYPAVLLLRASVLNALGKAYLIDKVYRLVQ